MSILHQMYGYLPVLFAQYFFRLNLFLSQRNPLPLRVVGNLSLETDESRIGYAVHSKPKAAAV